MNIDNLPVAQLVNTQNQSDNLVITNEIITVLANSNNARVIVAETATVEEIEENINTTEIVELAMSATAENNYNYLNNIFMLESQQIISNNIEAVSNENIIIYDEENKHLLKFLKGRIFILNSFFFILFLNIVYVFINPISLLFLFNILFNLYTLKYFNTDAFKLNAVINIIITVFILLSNIIITMNIVGFLKIFINNYDIILKIIWIYIPTLYLASILIIIMYLYMAFIFSELLIAYRRLPPEEVLILRQLLI